MLQSDNGNIRVEGNFSTLMFEISNLLHYLAKAITNEIDELDYEQVREAVVEGWSKFEEIQTETEDSIDGFMQTIILKKINKYKKKHQKDPGFISIEKQSPFLKKFNVDNTFGDISVRSLIDGKGK